MCKYNAVRAYTDGEIGGCLEEGTIILRNFSSQTEEKFTISCDCTKHSGDSGSVDRCHPNDLGFMCMAEAIGKIMEKVI